MKNLSKELLKTVCPSSHYNAPFYRRRKNFLQGNIIVNWKDWEIKINLQHNYTPTNCTRYLSIHDLKLCQNKVTKSYSNSFLYPSSCITNNSYPMVIRSENCMSRSKVLWMTLNHHWMNLLYRKHSRSLIGIAMIDKLNALFEQWDLGSRPAFRFSICYWMQVSLSFETIPRCKNRITL